MVKPNQQLQAREDEAPLSEEDIHDVLSNERRRMTLDRLREADGTLTTRELSEQIAEQETGESPPPRNIRQSAYVSLQQTHLPKLDELGIVEYDSNRKSVALRNRADEVSVYTEVVPRYGIAWSEYYLGVSLLGLLTVLGSAIGVPVVSAVAELTWATLFLAATLLSSIYQTVTGGASIFHRFGS